jgi:hypothetical protein
MVNFDEYEALRSEFYPIRIYFEESFEWMDIVSPPYSFRIKMETVILAGVHFEYEIGFIPHVPDTFNKLGTYFKENNITVNNKKFNDLYEKSVRLEEMEFPVEETYSIRTVRDLIADRSKVLFDKATSTPENLPTTGLCMFGGQTNHNRIFTVFYDRKRIMRFSVSQLGFQYHNTPPLGIETNLEIIKEAIQPFLEGKAKEGKIRYDILRIKEDEGLTNYETESLNRVCEILDNLGSKEQEVKNILSAF